MVILIPVLLIFGNSGKSFKASSVNPSAKHRYYISSNNWAIINSDPDLRAHYVYVLKKIKELKPGKYSNDSLISILKENLPTGPADDINSVVVFENIE